MAWAAAHGQGAPAEAVERAAAEFLARARRAPRARTPLSGGSRRAICSPTSRRSCTARRRAAAKAPAGSIARSSTRCWRARRFAPTAEQAPVIRGLTSSGHGVETVEALAGTGKTFTAGLLAQAYTAGGFRVLGTAPTGRAVRELTEQAGIGQAWTLTRLALDLDADDRGFGIGSGGVDPRRGGDGEHPRDRARHGARPRRRGEGDRDRRLRSALKRPGRRLAGLAHRAPGLATSCAR